MKPRGFDPAKKWPLVLEIHGGPHTAYGHSFFHEFHVLAGRGYAVLLTNPRGSHAYGQRFVEACVGDWGGKDYEDLMAGVDHVLALGWVDPKRLYVTGGSYGGVMTNWIVGHTDRFRAAVTQRSISNNISAFGTSDIGWHFWEHEMGDATPWQEGEKLIFRSPLTYVTNVKTPLLILHAERDLRCPIEQAEQLFTALKVLGKEAVLVRFPRSEEHTSELQSPYDLVCRLLLEKKNSVGRSAARMTFSSVTRILLPASICTRSIAMSPMEAISRTVPRPALSAVPGGPIAAGAWR